MRSNIQSISHLASPKIDDTEQQGTLPVGPTGVVHRRPEPRTEEELRDNREFLRVAGQVDFGPGKHILTLVWMAVAYYASLGPERICWAKVEKVAKKAKGLSTRTVQRKLNELAGLGRISTGKRSGGYKSTCWDVHLDPVEKGADTMTACHGEPRQRVMENHDSVSPDIRDRREGTEEKKAAAYVQGAVETVEKQAETPRADRNTCPKCANSWPSEYGKTCYVCPAKTKRGVYNAGQAAPVPGKYDFMDEPDGSAGSEVTRTTPEPDDTPRPDPAPMKPKLSAISRRTPAQRASLASAGSG